MLIPRKDVTPDPNQPRKTFDPEKLGELKDSMADRGPDQPLIVRTIGGGKYMIVTGERRWRACGDEEIECIVRDVDDKTARGMQFKENVQRVDIDPVELGKSFWEYRQKYKVTQQELADMIGVSVQKVSEYERLHTSTTSDVKERISGGQLTINEGAVISSISSKKKQNLVADAVVTRELKRPEVQQLVKQVKAEPTRPVSAIVQEVEQKKETAKIEEATTIIPEPERRAETKRAFSVASLKASIAPQVARAVANQPGRPVADIVAEEAYGTSELDKKLITNPAKMRASMDLFYEVDNQGKNFYRKLEALRAGLIKEFGTDTPPAYGVQLLVPLLRHIPTVTAKALEWLDRSSPEGKKNNEKEVAHNGRELSQ